MKNIYVFLGLIGWVSSFHLSLAKDAVGPRVSDTVDHKKVIVIGTTVGDFGDMVKESVSLLLKKRGYEVKLIEFSDYIRPNFALKDGSLDVNVFQHKPYLNEFVKAHPMDLTPIFEVPTAPLGLYAGRLKDVQQIKKGALISLPNDPTNLARSLAILSDLGWVRLKKEMDPLRASVGDILENPFELKWIQLDPAQIPRSRANVDFAIINGNWAVSSGIALTEALVIEKAGLFVNWGVVKSSDLQTPWVKDLIDVYRSSEFQKYAHTRFAGYRFPTEWKSSKGR